MPPESALDVNPRTYRGFKRIIATLLRIPREPAAIPVDSGELIDSFNPAVAWIRLRRLQIITKFSLATLGYLVFMVGIPMLGSLSGDRPALTSFFSGWSFLGPFEIVVLTVTFLSATVRLVFLRLQYDCTWYVMTARALRIRRGLWVINETTITYANIQNVTIRQGPLERFFGLSNIEVETAGGGGADSKGSDEGTGHKGLIEGVVDPERLRRRIMDRVRASRTAGLGDEHPEVSHAPGRRSGTRGPDPRRTAEVLGEIRDLLKVRT
jgi:hypothetical protein